MAPYTLLYAPDWPGMPVLVTDDVRQLYDDFSDGAPVGEVLSQFQGRTGKGFMEWLSVVNELVERGFLRDVPDAATFTPKPYHPSRKSMNVWLHINNYCNLACSYCFVEHTKTYMEEPTIDSTVSLISKTVRTHGVEDILIKFAGGEPTLTLPQMEYFFDRLTDELADTKAYVHWTVLTNGTNVNDRFLRFIDRAKATISISVDGYGDYHDLYRVYRTNEKSKRTLPVISNNKSDSGNAHHPKGSWSVINKNIEILRRNGIVPYINAMVGPKTSKGLPDLARWMFGNGMIGTIHVVRNLEDSWASGSHRKAQYGAYCDQLEEDFEKMFQELEHERYQINLPRWMEVAELYFDNPAPDICCGIGTDHIVIKHDGTLASCPMTVHEQTVIPTEDLFLSAKETFKASPDDRGSEECLSCQWFKVCASGCPVANQRIRGHAFMQSPLCSFWKYVIPRYVVFYGTKLLQAKKNDMTAIWSGVEAK
jgi:uncharacterized protein